MKLIFRQLAGLLAGVSLALSGCVTTGGNSNGDVLNVGPKLSSLFETNKLAKIDPTKPKLEVIVPVFDPGLSEEAASYQEEDVWPDLRRAEANRFAWKLKQALDETGAFGAVRVTPDASATGDLYVMGKIVESNGEDIEIEVTVADISGRHWITREFDHEVDTGFYKDLRNKGKDPYDPVFTEAANRIAVELEDIEDSRIEDVQHIAELRFGSHLTEESFNGYLSESNNQFELSSFPAASDPMLIRTRAIRVRDQLFVDGLQEGYRNFNDQMESSYLIWQEQSLLEIEAKREAEIEAAGKAVLGILAIGLAVLSVAAGSKSNSYNGQMAGLTGGVIAGVAGASLISNSFQTSKEAEVHRDALNELGQSIDIDMASQVIEYEKQTVELTGNAKEQFSVWREFLKQVYEAERTPNTQL